MKSKSFLITTKDFIKWITAVKRHSPPDHIIATPTVTVRRLLIILPQRILPLCSSTNAVYYSHCIAAKI
jgi:hypothetical protein